MKQTTFMLYIRYALYRLNKLERQTSENACFWNMRRS